MKSPRFLFCLVLATTVSVFAALLFAAPAAEAVTFSLEVSSEYGSPSPARGVSVYQSGVTVFCAVDEYVQVSDGVRMYCSGWTGTGSVPATGSTNSFHFEIFLNSTVTWLWERWYELKVLCDYEIPCRPALGTHYYKEGTEVALGAPLFVADLLFDGYAGTGEIPAGSVHHLEVTMNSPSSITWYYRAAELMRTPLFGSPAEVVDSGPRVGKYASVAVNPATHQPAISYFDEENGDLKYAWFDGTEWHLETADSSILVGQFTKLIFDESDSPVILYYGYGYRDLKIAHKDIEGNWYNDIVDESGFVGMYCDITVLPGARLGVSYYDETNGDLLYREFQDGFWRPEPHLVLDSDGDVGTYTAIATNPITGEPAVAYRSETEDCVYYIYREAGEWHRQLVTAIPGTGYFIDLAFDRNGVPYVVFQDYRNDPRTIDVIIAQQAGEVWISRVVQSAGDVGFYCSLAMDAAGFPHLVYYDDTVRGVRYTFWNGRFWVTDVVDAAGDHVGRFCSLALGDDGLPMAAYWADETLRFRKADSWGAPVTEPPAPVVEEGAHHVDTGGCFVATAAFGSYCAASVADLCGFRDRTAFSSGIGRGVVELYYRLSPEPARGLKDCSPLRGLVRRLLGGASKVF